MQGLSDIRAMDAVVRFAFGGTAVALSAVVSRLLGGRIGGVFAAFPAVFLSAVITTTLGLSEAESGKAVNAVSQGALIGMAANIVCAVAATFGVRRFGVGRGLVYAIVVWLAVSGSMYALLTAWGVL